MSMISVRFSRDLAASVRHHALISRISVSEWLRRMAQREVDEMAPIEVTLGPPFVGATQFRVSAELVRAAAEESLREQAHPRRTFTFPHWSICNVTSAADLTCIAQETP